MCIAVPALVLEVQGDTALIQVEGVPQRVSLVLLADEVQPGDYLRVRSGGFATERLEADEAQQVVALMRELAERHEGHDMNAWSTPRDAAL